MGNCRYIYLLITKKKHIFVKELIPVTMKINSFLYTTGIVLGIVVCVAVILLNYPVWIAIVAPILLITVLVVLGEKLDKKENFANDRRLSRLIHKAVRLKTHAGDTEELEKELTAACQGHPEAWKGYRVLGELFLVRENRSKARDYFLKADKALPADDKSPDRCAIWNNLGAITLMLGHGKEAIEYYLKSAAIVPTFFRGPGLMHEFGWAIPQDTVAAEWMYRKAVEAGNGEAIANLYELLWREQNNIPRDYWQGYADYLYGCHCGRTQLSGASSLMSSAKKGYAPAQFELGTLYMNGTYGEDVPTRRREAFKWLRASADQGFLPGMHNLGFMCQQCVIDPEKGDIYKPSIKGSILYDRDIVRHCALEGHKLILKAAEEGFPPSQHSIGMRYILGGQNLVEGEYRGVFEKDASKAKYWLEKAAAQGFLPAKKDLEKYFG